MRKWRHRSPLPGPSALVVAVARLTRHTDTISETAGRTTPLGAQNSGAEGEFFDIDLSSLRWFVVAGMRLPRPRNRAMHLLIPPEMLSAAAQLAVYFVTIVAALMSFMMTARG